LIFAYSIQFMVLPSFTELEKRSTERFSQVSVLSTLIYSIMYFSMGMVGVFLFGSETKVNFLLNLSEDKGSISVFCRTIYIFLLMCHVPYLFFPTKEYLLVLYDEIMSRSLSNKLEAKLAHFFTEEDSEEYED